MARIDRNAQATNRTRRDWQRLTLGTATAKISLTSTSGNLITSTATGYQVVIPEQNSLYVDLDGTDSTGTPNVFGRPYRNISTALNAASSLAPATVWVGPGSFDLGSTNFTNTSSGSNPSGVNIIGAGNCRGDKSRGGTIFLSNRPYSTGRVCVPGNDVYYTSFYIEALNSTTHDSVALGFLSGNLGNDLPSNNVLLRDVGVYGSRAGIALAGSTTVTPSNYVLIDCWIQGNQVGLNTHNTAAQSTWLNLSTIDCIINGLDAGSSTLGGTLYGVNFTQYGSWLDIDSIITASEISTSGTIPVEVVTAKGSTVFELHGTVLSAINSSGGVSIHAQADTGSVITLDVGVKYNPQFLSTTTGGAIFAPFLSTGDILTTTSSGNISPIHIGTNGYVLTVDSTSAFGISWQSTSGGGGSTTLPIVSTGDLLTIGSTGSTTRLPHGTPYTVLTTVPSTASSTDLQWLSTLQYSTGTTSLDFQLGIGGDASGFPSLDWNNRVLYDSVANASVRWGSYVLLDSSGVLSVNWDTRNAYTTVGAIAWHWAGPFSTGDILVYHSTTDGFLPMRIGSTGQVLTVVSTSTATSTSTAWVTPSTGSGTVTSVALSIPPDTFTISGSPITTSGTFTIGYQTQGANLFWASPNGTAGLPTWRAIGGADLLGAVFPVVTSDPVTHPAGEAWFNSTQPNAKVALYSTMTSVINNTITANATVQTLTASTGNQTFSSTVVNFPAGFWNNVNRTVALKVLLGGNTTSLTNNFGITATWFGSTVNLYSTGGIITGNAFTVWCDCFLQTRSTGASGLVVIVGNVTGINTTTNTLLLPGSVGIGISINPSTSTSFSLGFTASTTNAGDSLNTSAYIVSVYN